MGNTFNKIIALFSVTTLVAIWALSQAAPIHAAQFYNGQTVNLSASDYPKDAYIAGNTVLINTSTTNDLVVAGNTINIHGNVENGLLAAGGNVTVDGNVGQSARIAGGTVIINGQVNRDLIIFGGDVTVSNTASVHGDLVVLGGTVTVDGPVSGKITVNGGQVKLNSTAGSVDAHVQQLQLTGKAVINGDLTYQAPQEATIDSSAIIKGQTNFQHANSNQNLTNAAAFSTFGFFYNLLASLIFAFVLLYLFHKLTARAVLNLKQWPWLALAWGLGVMFLFPILAIFLSILSIYLGIASFVLYALVMISAFFLAQILLGWWLLTWWFGRTKETYQLDWRAVVVGVLATAALFLVPVLGWAILFLMLVFAVGTIGMQVWSLRQGA